MSLKLNKKGLMNLLIFLGVVVAIYFATQKYSVTGVEGFDSDWANFGMWFGIVFASVIVGYFIGNFFF